MNVRCDRMSLSKARCRKEGSQAGAPFFISALSKITLIFHSQNTFFHSRIRIFYMKKNSDEKKLNKKMNVRNLIFGEVVRVEIFK